MTDTTSIDQQIANLQDQKRQLIVQDLATKLTNLFESLPQEQIVPKVIEMISSNSMIMNFVINYLNKQTSPTDTTTTAQ